MTFTRGGPKDNARVKTITVTFEEGTVTIVTPEPTATPNPEDIVDAAYELEQGASLPGTHTLTGVITRITDGYSSQYHNITVEMVVGSKTDKPILCYHLKDGTVSGVDSLYPGDTITVEGTLTNYKGTIEFADGCLLNGLVSGSHPVYDTPEEILNAAYELSNGAILPGGPYQLTGVVTEIINTGTFNSKTCVTVNMIVDDFSDKPIQCYKLVDSESIESGRGIEILAVGNKITVEGHIKNFNGTIEFDSGCKLIDIRTVRITSASLTLTNSIAINFKVDATQFDLDQKTPLLKISFDGHDYPLVADGPDSDNMLVFSFKELTPAQMTVPVTATLYLRDMTTEEYDECDTIEYSIATYCYRQLRKTNDGAFKKLLVDLLVYGDASMNYTGKSGTRPTYDLTEAERAHGTQGEPDVNGFGNVMIRPGEDGLVWKGAGLNLTDSIMIRMKFQAVMDEDHNVVKVEDNETHEIFEIGSEDWLPVEGAENTYYVFFPLSSPMDLMKKYIFMIDNYVAQIDYSASYYVKSMLFKDFSGETQDLLNAMTNYCLSVIDYVG